MWIWVLNALLAVVIIMGVAQIVVLVRRKQQTRLTQQDVMRAKVESFRKAARTAFNNVITDTKQSRAWAEHGDWLLAEANRVEASIPPEPIPGPKSEEGRLSVTKEE